MLLLETPTMMNNNNLLGKKYEKNQKLNPPQNINSQFSNIILTSKNNQWGHPLKFLQSGMSYDREHSTTRLGGLE
jgi:hypothetical protein